MGRERMKPEATAGKTSRDQSSNLIPSDSTNTATSEDSTAQGTLTTTQQTIKDDDRKYELYVPLFRVTLISLVITGLRHQHLLQHVVDQTYAYLLSTWFFNSVYFETLLVTLCYAIAMIYPWGVDKVRFLDKYKVHPSVKYEHMTIAWIAGQAVLYVAPLMVLDAVKIKKYPGIGIDPEIWTEQQKSFIQTTRALPVDAPSVLGIVYQLVASFVLYDALFFALHLILHKNAHLYKYIHKRHHDHGRLHSHVTNQLTVVERLSLVLTANYALKCFESHPLTRMIFVPIFVAILVENHTGYDMPFGYHRALPFGLIGGSPTHFQHHANGRHHFQPIFTYLDKLYEYFQSGKMVNVDKTAKSD